MVEEKTWEACKEGASLFLKAASLKAASQLSVDERRQAWLLAAAAYYFAARGAHKIDSPEASELFGTRHTVTTFAAYIVSVVRFLHL